MMNILDAIEIRELEGKDLKKFIKVLHVIRNDIDAAVASLSEPEGQSEQDVRAWLENNNCRNDRIFLGIFCKAQLAGYVQFTEENRKSGVGEIGIMIEKSFRNLGIGNIAVAKFVDYLTSNLGYRKFVVRVLATNKGSKKIFENNNFEEVGRLKKHRFIEGIYQDVFIMEKIVE